MRIEQCTYRGDLLFDIYLHVMGGALTSPVPLCGSGYQRRGKFEAETHLTADFFQRCFDVWHAWDEIRGGLEWS